VIARDLFSEISNLSEGKVRDPYGDDSPWAEGAATAGYRDLSLRSRFQKKAEC
jgi:hypothetical protein